MLLTSSPPLQDGCRHSDSVGSKVVRLNVVGLKEAAFSRLVFPCFLTFLLFSWKFSFFSPGFWAFAYPHLWCSCGCRRAISDCALLWERSRFPFSSPASSLDEEWFPDLLRLASDTPRLIPSRGDLLRQPHVHRFCHAPHALRLTAWTLSSDSCATRVIPDRLHNSWRELSGIPLL